MPSNGILTVKRRRRGRRPLNLEKHVKVERSRRSARECRARKRLRYQYLEDLVGCKENAVYQLRKELKSLFKMCKTFDTCKIPESMFNIPSKEQITANSAGGNILPNEEFDIPKMSTEFDLGDCIESQKEFYTSSNGTDTLFALLTRTLLSEAKSESSVNLLNFENQNEYLPPELPNVAQQNDGQTSDAFDVESEMCLDIQDNIKLTREEAEIVDLILQNESELETKATDDEQFHSPETFSPANSPGNESQDTISCAEMSVQDYVDYLKEDSDSKSFVVLDDRSYDKPYKFRRHSFSHFGRSSNIEQTVNNQIRSLDKCQVTRDDLPNNHKSVFRRLCHSMSVKDSYNSSHLLNTAEINGPSSINDITKGDQNTQEKFPFLSLLLTTEKV